MLALDSRFPALPVSLLQLNWSLLISWPLALDTKQLHLRFGSMKPRQQYIVLITLQRHLLWEDAKTDFAAFLLLRVLKVKASSKLWLEKKINEITAWLPAIFSRLLISRITWHFCPAASFNPWGSLPVRICDAFLAQDLAQSYEAWNVWKYLSISHNKRVSNSTRERKKENDLL